MSSFSLRRQARLRREFLFKKNIEQTQVGIQRRKEKIKRALDEGRRIDPKLQKDAFQLMESGKWDDVGPRLAVELSGEVNDIDDEYRWAGVKDPKICLTTSNGPSSKLRQFAKECKILFPNCQRMNRGNHNIKSLVQACIANDFTDFIMLHETKGNPDCMIISHMPNGPTACFTLADVVMRHDIPDIGTMSEQFPHLIFHNFKSALGKRVRSVLKYLFPAPKEDSQRLVTFVNWDDWILFRHHTYKKVDGGKSYQLGEVGPRFTMRLFKIFQGTVDQEAAANHEFVLRPYMNTAKKRRFLSSNDPW